VKNVIFGIVINSFFVSYLLADQNMIKPELPDYPEQYPLYEITDDFFTSEPEVEIRENGEAVISWITKMPTHAGRVYYGVYLPEQDLDYPRYRMLGLEKLDTLGTEHSVMIDIKRFEREIYDAAHFAERKQGVICYRVELFDPEYCYTRFFNGRFHFRKSEHQYSKSVTIIQGPFIDQISANSAIVSWETDVPGYGYVDVNGELFNDNKSSLRHEVKITKLSAGKHYDYYIASWQEKDSVRSRTYRFETPARNAKNFSFGYLSDSREGVGGGEEAMGGVNYGALRDLFSAMYYQDVKFILFGGDLIDGYVTDVKTFEDQLRVWNQAVEPIGHYIPIYEGMGNHEALVFVYDDSLNGFWFDREGAESAEAVFAKRFVNPLNGPEPEGPNLPTYKENVYSFDYGNTHIICFNTNYFWSSDPEEYGGNLEGYVMDKQMAWIEKDLKAARGKGLKHIIMFAHEPAFPNSGHLHDAQWYSGGDSEKNQGFDRTYIVQRRDKLWTIISKYDVLAVCFGDEHNYQRVLIHQNTPVYADGTTNGNFINPVWQVVNGCAGAPFYGQVPAPWTSAVKKFSMQHGYTIFSVRGDKVFLRHYGRLGQLIDECELTAVKK